MLPNPEDERRRLVRRAIVFTLVALYIVVAFELWHYALYGR